MSDNLVDEEMVRIKIKMDEGAASPVYKKAGDAGADLCSIEEVIIPSMERVVVKTGLYFEIPEGFEVQIRSRSGLAAKHGIFCLNSPGTIDCIPIYEKIKTENGYKSLKEISESENFNIVSFNIEKNIEEIDAIKSVWSVGEKEVFEIVFEDGSSVRTTETQLLLTKSGWVKLSELNIGDEVISL